MSITAVEDSQDGDTSVIHRSASYNHIPELNSHDPGFDVKRTLSEVNLTSSSGTQPKVDHASFTAGKEVLRRSSLRLSKNKKKSDGPVFTLSAEETTEASVSTAKTPLGAAERTPPKSRSVSSAIASFARKPWASSRSPSPSPASKERRVKNPPGSDLSSRGTNPPALKGGVSGREAEQSSIPSQTPESNRRSREVLAKRTQRPLSTISAKSKNESPGPVPRRPSLPSLRARVSLERLAASVGVSSSEPPPMPQGLTNRLAYSREPLSRKKDELWAVFRGLDADYQKFQSKSTSLKANVVRSSLIPMLSRYANHPSNKSLRPEDLDRRVNILNKWWTGLLEILNGRNSQSITGTDRPVYLEAILGIMTRPEWRIPHTPSSLPTTPTGHQTGSVSRSTTSLESTGSDFLVESIYHNIRNIVAQNLLSQMTYAVDRMSLRQTPASLVSFCAKTCVYAFFFCPGVADILVRLWNTNTTSLRRIMAEFQTDASPNLRLSRSEETLCSFPAPVRSLGATSHAAIIRYLRRKTVPPLGASHINWSGPWLSRWCGRDTDLLFTFTKHFHILVAELLPPETEISKWVYVPGLALLYSQLLTVLENTLNKLSAPQATNNLYSASTTTFDDFIDGSEASATAMPLGAANSFRLMSENRLIYLVKEVMADRSMDPLIKQVFVHALCKIVKVGARKTSIFNHNACFVLCDFLEELIPVIHPYCKSTQQLDLLDWDFWLQVCEEMMKSNNCLTEVRVFSFLYSSWEVINHTDEGKERLCLRLLLDETFFYRYFGHWSAMVRAYFHRLLCWRLARYEGEPSALDKRIYKTFSERLATMWNSYLVYQTSADKALRAPLSIAPCSPAPGRHIAIIRNDFRPAASMFVCLDNVVPPALGDDGAAHRGNDSNASSTESAQPSSKKRWRMLKNMFGGPTNNKPGEVTPPGSSSEDNESPLKDDSSTSPMGQGTSQLVLNSNIRSSVTGALPRLPRYTFRFSLELDPRSRRPTTRLNPPCLPIPAHLFLQSLREREIEQSDSGSGSVANTMSGTGSDDGSSSDDNAYGGAITDLGLPISRVKRDVSTSLQTIGDERSIVSKYSGRALAEWSQVVSDCNSFFERRRDEGVPHDRMVEIPTLGVEPFRK
ncbi:hypothetical protein AJ80_00948 [Polytolypa hystricis UAMH7299]|uniref:DUF1765-domain-containing protein n=1 Tax=Polytolypa hystricis (strain UAMH7299) TaxID=1447883 RepID=A0A2B7Z2W7_POLH7|nr:hypothetical protein AJ80_00948 [Polytolypa hystricis UAMH7299]